MNEPNLGPIANPPMTHEQVMKAFTDFINYSTTTLSKRYTGDALRSGRLL